jgi:hypothetical protein
MRRYQDRINSDLRLTCSSEYEETLRNLKIRDQPIAEDETEAQRAMKNMASQLRMVCFILIVCMYSD